MTTHTAASRMTLCKLKTDFRSSIITGTLSYAASRRNFDRVVRRLGYEFARIDVKVSAASLLGDFIAVTTTRVQPDRDFRDRLRALGVVPAGDISDHLSISHEAPLNNYLQSFAMTPGPRAVTVAVMDSGIDYTHLALGGSGDEAAFRRAYGVGFERVRALRRKAILNPERSVAVRARANRRVRDRHGQYFPTDVVVGGIDYVGESWRGRASRGLRPDANPIDVNGHGTGAASIVHAIAPAAHLIAIKVAAPYSRQLSTKSIINGLDFCLDPFGTRKLSPVDVLNMSFGLPGSDAYELLDDAVEQLRALGVLCVAALGRDEDDLAMAPATCSACIGVTAAPSGEPPTHTLRIGGVDIQLTHQWFSPSSPVGEFPICRAAPKSGSVWVTNPDGPVSQLVEDAARAGAAACVLLVTEHQQYDNELDSWPLIPAYTATRDIPRTATVGCIAALGAPANPAHFASKRTLPPSIGADLQAPEGMPCATAATGDRLARHSGSSSAAPIVAAVAANMLSHNPNMTAEQAQLALTNGADHFFSPPMVKPLARVPFLVKLLGIGQAELLPRVEVLNITESAFTLKLSLLDLDTGRAQDLPQIEVPSQSTKMIKLSRLRSVKAALSIQSGNYRVELPLAVQD